MPGSASVQAHTVTNVIVTKTDRDFVTVTIGTTGKDGKPVALGKLTTTFHHPFYDITQAAFVDAQHLKPGDKLQTTDTSKVGTPASGTGGTRDGPATVTILAIHLYHGDTVTYDLTIGDLHTYYVEAGTTPVLVHNCDVCEQVDHGSTELSRATASQRLLDNNKGNLCGSAKLKDGRILVAHSDENGHAEEYLLEQAKSKGYSRTI